MPFIGFSTQKSMLFGYLMAGTFWQDFRSGSLLSRNPRYMDDMPGQSRSSLLHQQEAQPHKASLLWSPPPTIQTGQMGVVQKSFHFFPGLSQDLREAFASFRAWGFTSVGENGFSLGLEAFKDSCPGTSCVL